LAGLGPAFRYAIGRREPERMSSVVDAAREWIGTPYLHQASCKGVGCDCLGLIRGVWRDLHGDEPEPVPPYSTDWGEPRGEELLYDAAMRHMLPVEDAPLAAGQVVLFRMRHDAVAKHLGFISVAGARPRFIHAYARHGVVESPLSKPWRRKIAARFSIT